MESLKINKAILLKADDSLVEAENALKKGKFQSVQLMDNLAAEGTEFQKLYSWDDCRIMSEILLDYVVKTEKKIEEIREAFDLLWNQKSEKAEEKIMEGGRKQ